MLARAGGFVGACGAAYAHERRCLEASLGEGAREIRAPHRSTALGRASALGSSLFRTHEFGKVLFRTHEFGKESAFPYFPTIGKVLFPYFPTCTRSEHTKWKPH